MNNTTNDSYYSNAFGWVDPEPEVRDLIGILPDSTKQEKDYLMVWKNDPGVGYDYATDGRGLPEIGAKSNLDVEGYVKIADSASRPNEPEVIGQTLFCTGNQKQSRVHAGNFPVIRAIEDRNSRKGYSTKFKNKVAVFANETGDIMPHSTSFEFPDFDFDNPDKENNDPSKQDP